MRLGAVTSKEVGMLLRQPRLLAVLLAGPVLIMVVFALSFHFDLGKPRVAVVVEPGSPGAKLFEELRKRFESRVDVALVTQDEGRAEQLLRNGKLDGVVVVPPRPLDRIRSGKHATLKVRYRSQNELFGYVVPSRASALVQSLNRLFVRRLLSDELSALRSSRGNLDALSTELEEARSLERTLSSPQTRRTTNQLRSTLSDLEGTLKVIEGIAPDGLHDRVAGALRQVRSTEKLLGRVQRLEHQAQKAKENGTLSRLDEQLSLLRRATSRIPPDVSAKLLVSPLRLDLKNVARFQPTIVQYYAPGVLSLLVQHVALSLASLAIVREYLGGSKELFDVSPLRDSELLFGKFLAYVLSALAANAVVAAALIWYLHLPVSTRALESLAASMVLVALSSVALGLLLSVLVRREIQAVEISMLVLIGSVFFAGFLFPFHMISGPARAVSYVLPSTYGIDAMQSALLDGRWFSVRDLAALVALTLIPLALALSLLRRRKV
ncbi:ABC transporter permease [Rubrobacter naiadicus]|uniref:ABC transporter permease n=1 Tax=Rubrobacter naiadicus TaxID=1392641 RepID=UPI0023616D85|nr:ABC transporter permease [Rubrobacter naiadicus]